MNISNIYRSFANDADISNITDFIICKLNRRERKSWQAKYGTDAKYMLILDGDNSDCVVAIGTKDKQEAEELAAFFKKKKEYLQNENIIDLCSKRKVSQF